MNSRDLRGSSPKIARHISAPLATDDADRRHPYRPPAKHSATETANELGGQLLSQCLGILARQPASPLTTKISLAGRLPLGQLFLQTPG